MNNQNNSSMEIKIEQARAAYEVADENGKKMLEALFGADTFKKQDDRPVTERIKTFADACHAVGIEDPEEWEENYADVEPDILAYFKLRIICKALNEGWEPKFTLDEWRWYPWFLLWTDDELRNKSDKWKQERSLMGTGDYETQYAGFGYADSNYAPSNAYAYIGSRLCLKSESVADYCGKQFIDIWADFLLIRK